MRWNKSRSLAMLINHPPLLFGYSTEHAILETYNGNHSNPMFKKNLAHFIIFISILIDHLPVFAWSFFPRAPEPELIIPEIPPPPRYTLIIDPAGGANAGREIDDAFEGTLTLEFAQALRKTIEEKLPGVRVIFTRLTGDLVDRFQNTSFANRLNPDLYLSIHISKQKEKDTKLFIYRLLYNPATDLWDKKVDELSLLPYRQAYRLHLQKTATISKTIYDECRKEKMVSCMPPQSFPFKPLAGLTAPAIGIEIGIRKKDDWQKCIPLLATAIEVIIGIEKPAGIV